jgi:phospholipase/carboxylesterase
MIDDPSSIVVETGPQPLASVIWLHGLGADGHDFEGIVPMLGIPADLPTRFIFPHAPVRPITVNGGMRMRGWYDIRSMGINEEEDAEGVRESAAILADLIAAEMAAGILPEKIVVAGFSQGGAIALFQGLRQQDKLAGILALSTYLPLASTLQAEIAPQARGLQVFMGHGTQDPIVPVHLGEMTRDLLTDNGLDVSWNSYTMAHSVVQEEIADIGRWLASVLNT